MWQKFTERARRVILLGQQEAAKCGTSHVCTQHLLLGITRDEGCVAAQLLMRMQIPPSALRAQLESQMQPPPRPVVVAPRKPSLWKQITGARSAPAPVAPLVPPEPKLTPLAKRVLELAVDEARRLKHDYIGTEHLLLALIRQDTAMAAIVLFKAGLTLEKARPQLVEYLGTDEAKAAKSAPLLDVPDAGQWARFTERARLAIVLGQNEAQTTGCDHVGTAHLLVGLLLETEGIAAQILLRRGLSATAVRAQITAQPASQKSEKAASLTPRAKLVLQRASEEARRHQHNYISTEHLLLGIARSSDSLAATILRGLGQSRKDIYTEVSNSIVCEQKTILTEVQTN